MTLQRAEGARIALSRSGRLVSVAALALLAPLMLSACVSDRDKLTGTANLAPQPGQAPSDVAAAGAPKTEVVQIASNDTGPSRVILPSARPEPTVAVADAKGPRVVASAKVEAPSPVQVAALAPDTRAPVAAAPKGIVARAADTAVAAKDAAKGGVISAKDTVVAHAAKVGSGAAAVASASVATMQTVAKAVGDTITGDPKIDQLIEEAADENDLPREFAYAVVRVESHYKPNALGGGAYGLSQIKPATARGLGFEGPANALFDPKTNLRYGMRYLKGALEKGGGDICQAAMKYKGGHRTTVMSKSASVYCSNVKRHMAAIRARKTPAMSGTQTLVAAVEPTVRPGIIARTVAERPVTVQAATTRMAAKNLPGVAVVAMTGTVQPTSGAAAAVAEQKAKPVPSERPVNVADNRAAKAAVANGAIPLGGMVGGRVVHKAAQPDTNRFGGTFDDTAPASSGTTAGGLSFN